MPGDDTPGGGAPQAAEVKAVRLEVQKLWPDSAARLARVEAALEAQQVQPGGEGGEGT